MLQKDSIISRVRDRLGVELSGQHRAFTCKPRVKPGAKWGAFDKLRVWATRGRGGQVENWVCLGLFVPFTKCPIGS